MGTALVVGLLVVMCGGIAYVGDLLGRRMGKKRLSLFGLRPRHTAVVFTTVTGMVIASITLGALMLLSRGVRIAVTRGEQLLYDNHRLKQQRRHLDLVRRQLIVQREDLEKTNKTLAEGNAVLLSAQSRLRAEAALLQQHNRVLQTTNEALGKRNSLLEVRNANLVKGNLALTGRNRVLSSKNGILAQDNHRLIASNQKLIARNAGLNSRNQGLLVEKAGLEQARNLAQTQLTRLHGELTHTQDDLTQAQKQLLSAQRILTEAQSRINRGENLAAGNVIVHRGEELARRVIPAGASAEVVRGTLRNLLDEANAEVTGRVSHVNGRARRVCLYPSSAPANKLAEQMATELMTERHSVGGQVPGTPMPEIHPLVVRAVASRNASDDDGDPVEVEIESRMNMLAFRKGDEIASFEMSTASTSGQILKGLIAFLQGKVREAAVKHSVLPDAADHASVIDYEELLDVVARVKRLPGRALIGAVAEAEAWTAGPLRLDFYVVPAGTRVAKDKDKGE